MASNTRGISLSKISPRFLHSNSTSHTWVFSAFAELIDNAYDPDVRASDLLIDKVEIGGETCLIFSDNGAGMDREQLHKMLSFGFCEKEVYENTGTYLPIGHYGNGFKSGSMRIGKDALVFTRSTQSASIGFLSQSYLHEINAESVVIPILDYRLPHLERIKSQESRNNLNAILAYSVFKHENELKEELKALEGWKTGTKIIISTLSRLKDGNLELDFLSDPTDIRCPDPYEVDLTSVYDRPIQQFTSDYKLSLKAYCSIFFLKPRMKITIRGNRVKSRLISRSLANSEKDSYKPTWLKDPIRITFGFTCERERSEDYGVMLYYRNRLIKAYERVGCQTRANEQGVGVVGVAEVNCLQPTHNKQDFLRDEKYNSFLRALANKLTEYWNEKMGINPTQPLLRDSLPDWTWAQCEFCLQWRRMPDSVNADTLPNKWYCYLNPDGNYNRCEIPEEPEDEDLAVMPKYEKTVKKRREEERRQRRLQQAEEEKRKQEREKRLQETLKQREAELKAMQQKIRMQEAAAASTPSPKRQHQKETRATSSRQPESPTKRRRAVVESLRSNASKKLRIKTATGKVVPITRNFAGNEDQNTKNSTSRTSRASAAAKAGAKSSGKLKVSLKQTSEKKNQEKACEKQKSPAAPALSEASDKSPGVEGVIGDNATTDCAGESMEVESNAENAPEEEISNCLDTLLDTAIAAVRQRADKEKQVTSDGTDGSSAVDVSTGASVPVSVPEPARAVSVVTTTAANTSSFNTTETASASPCQVTTAANTLSLNTTEVASISPGPPRAAANITETASALSCPDTAAANTIETASASPCPVTAAPNSSGSNTMETASASPCQVERAETETHEPQEAVAAKPADKDSAQEAVIDKPADKDSAQESVAAKVADTDSAQEAMVAKPAEKDSAQESTAAKPADKDNIAISTTTSAASSPVPVTSLSKQKVSDDQSESSSVNGSIDHGISENNDVNMDSDTDRSNKGTDNGADSCISEKAVRNVGVTNNAQMDKNANDETVISQRQAPNDPVGKAENVNETNVALHGETGSSPNSSKPAEPLSSNSQSPTSCISHTESNSKDSLPTPSQNLDSAALHPEPDRASENSLISHECSNETQSQMQEELISLRKEVTLLRSEAAKTQALLKTLRRNVYKYLQLQVPDIDLGDEQLIDQLLQTMVDDN